MKHCLRGKVFVTKTGVNVMITILVILLANSQRKNGIFLFKNNDRIK
jgi:hypothetical protein